ncbi:MAG: hypothetical protein HYT73_04975 [Candidatus Aenigmarchaeota archaeon]|nr:hypothetical protein [Candidatus Aenigmarchaeota archaeon]
MKRVLFDANIYGEIVIDPDIDTIKEKIKNFGTIYGFRVIRNKMRKTSKSKYVGNKELRILLLNLYDDITRGREFDATEEMSQIAQSYYKAYREFGGSKSLVDIIEDFIIIACASVHEIDIVVSDDEKSMLTENAVRAYALVNSIVKKRTPNFIDYEEFKRRLFRG